MNCSRDDEGEQILRRFVQGKIPWTDLKKAGITVEFFGREVLFDHPKPINITISMRDIAMGILANVAAVDPLQRWAIIVLGGGLFDLEDAFDTEPEGDILLNALWDASFGCPMEPSAISIAQGLAGQSDPYAKPCPQPL